MKLLKFLVGVVICITLGILLVNCQAEKSFTKTILKTAENTTGPGLADDPALLNAALTNISSNSLIQVKHFQQLICMQQELILSKPSII